MSVRTQQSLISMGFGVRRWWDELSTFVMTDTSQNGYTDISPGFLEPQSDNGFVESESPLLSFETPFFSISTSE